VKEGDFIQIGTEKLDILDAPGHSKCGLIAVDYINHLIFVGDSIFARSVGRTDIGGDFNTLMKTIHDKIMYNERIDDAFQIFPGHMDPTSVGVERRMNPFRKYFLE
jgi:glyoxylase-like metal-dependent hydrolase (beta-lactamase superfamily II)